MEIQRWNDGLCQKPGRSGDDVLVLDLRLQLVRCHAAEVLCDRRFSSEYDVMCREDPISKTPFLAANEACHSWWKLKDILTQMSKIYFYTISLWMVIVIISLIYPKKRAELNFKMDYILIGNERALCGGMKDGKVFLSQSCHFHTYSGKWFCLLYSWVPPPQIFLPWSNVCHYRKSIAVPEMLINLFSDIIPVVGPLVVKSPVGFGEDIWSVRFKFISHCRWLVWKLQKIAGS